MDIEKFHNPKSGECHLFGEDNDFSLKVMNELFREARKDFPSLTEDAVDLSIIQGRRCPGQFGIRFTPKEAVPKAYQATNL